MPRLITFLRDLPICDTVVSRGTQWQDMPSITRFLYLTLFPYILLLLRRRMLLVIARPLLYRDRNGNEYPL